MESLQRYFRGWNVCHTALKPFRFLRDHIDGPDDLVTKCTAFLDSGRVLLILTFMPSPTFRLRGFQRLSDAVHDSLGRLERQMLAEVRRSGETSVRQVWEMVGEAIAYTTIMTTLDRLYRKGLLSRRKVGRAFLYSSKFSVGELERGVAEDVIGNLLDTNTGPVEPVLACIVDAVSDRDRLFLDDLERLVREKRLEIEARK